MMYRKLGYFVILFFLLITPTIFFNVSLAAENRNTKQSSTKNNPLTAKAFIIRYWNNHISTKLPIPSFLLSKASPLTAAQSACLTKLAGQNALSSQLRFFCYSANLFCVFEKASAKLDKDANSTIHSNRRRNMEFSNYDMRFSTYDINRNNNGSSFKNYSDETNFGVAIFKDYSKESGGHNGTEPGEDSVKPNAKNQSSANKMVNNVDLSEDSTFQGYGKGVPGLTNITVGFTMYLKNFTFRDYLKNVTFSKYVESSDTKPEISQKKVSSFAKPLVEPGRFFRESMLKEGNVMAMPDIKDKMPTRSFLPKSVASQLPFSSSSISQIKRIFNAPDKSAMERVVVGALADCERAPNRDETKQCVGSIEDMIDFATSILGQNVVVRTTENTNGSKNNVMIGSVKGINGRRVTNVVSCHQSLYPYLLYYCHSVPKVKVYEVDILDVGSKAEINHGVALCHMDTSSWSPRHGAFVALGPGPGKIEVCHWIFENDMTWTLAD